MDLSKLNKDNIEIIESTVKSINGEIKVESITLEDQTIEVSGVFVSIANVPETKYILKNFTLDEQGNVLAEEDVKTNKKKVYVAGDVRQKRLRQVATAVSDGALAATIAIREMED
jgi:thioredoxin reductase (NADPH)